MTQSTTRERLVTEAMALFSQQGFKATKRRPDRGRRRFDPRLGCALYHHFKSMNALLEAGIDRQLDRRVAMRDIRALFAGLNDQRTELTLLGRYLLSVLDDETQLLQVAARTPASHPTRLRNAYAALVDGLYAELGDWVRQWAPGLDAGTARTISVVAVDALIGRRMTQVLFHATETQASDVQYVTECTALLAARIHEAKA